MISYQYTITNKNGESITLNDHSDPLNVFALQQYPKFTRNIKNTELERVGQNNYWDFFSYNGKMSISFAGVIVAEDHQTLEQMKTQMMKVFAIPFQSSSTQDGYVTIRWTDDDGIAKEIEAKIIQDIAFDRRIQRRTVMDFQIQLKAKKNYITNQGGYTGSATGQRGYFSSGFTLPTVLPFSMLEAYNNKLVVTPTSAGALPIIRLYGENQQLINNPRVLNLDTGEEFKLNLTLNGASQYVEINTEEGTVVNHEGNDVSGYIDLASGFITLGAGANNLVYLSDEDPFVTGLMPESGTRFSVSYKEIYTT